MITGAGYKITNSNMPLISIITVVYNGVEVIEKAILSVVNQTYTNIEYIIIDGGSTDGTVDIIKKFENKITYWVSEKDNGIYDAINKGIAKSTGSLIGIINSDDWYEKNTIETLAKSYAENPGYDVYYGLLRFWDKGPMLMAVQGYTHNFLPMGMISHPTCFVTAACYKKHGLFDTTYTIAADYHFMLNLWKKGGTFFFIEHILANFMSGGVSTTSVYITQVEQLKIKKSAGLVSGKSYFIKRIFLWIKQKAVTILT